MDFAISERWCSFLLELILFGVFPISPPVDGFCMVPTAGAASSWSSLFGGDHELYFEPIAACDRPLLGTSFCKFLPPSCLMNADFRDLPLLHCACSSQHRPSPIEFLWRRVEGVVCARPLSSSWAQVLRSTFSARQRTPGDLVGVWPLLSGAT